ncbi:MAG: fused MFS/spermidine synthase [Lewinella sp.]|nr:fused MFS/spermidine synthase [Lewinella sp.]
MRRGRYQLSTAHAIYSFGDLYLNFRRAFERFDWAEHPVEDVLLLGLGLGSIPLMLEETFHQNCRYTAVEIDEQVIDLAYRYVLSDLDSPIEMICADATAAVAQLPDESYDLICMDIFLDDTVPNQFESPDFLQALERLLRPGGVLLYNRLASKTKDKRDSQAFFNGPFTEVFPAGRLLDVRGNYLLVSPGTAIE